MSPLAFDCIWITAARTKRKSIHRPRQRVVSARAIVQDPNKLVISRVATIGHETACSALDGALCRAGKALGYREAWAYTLSEEPGTSLRAAGFMDMGPTDGGEHDRPSRRRKRGTHPEKKRRWLQRLNGKAIGGGHG